MLSKSLESTQNKTFAIASNYKHDYATFGHLPLVLLEDVEACAVFQEYNINLMNIYNQIDHLLRSDPETFIDEHANVAKQSIGFQWIPHGAATHGHAANYWYINGSHTLVKLFFEANIYAVHCLNEHGITRTNVINYLIHNCFGSINEGKSNIEKYDEMFQTKK